MVKLIQSFLKNSKNIKSLYCGKYRKFSSNTNNTFGVVFDVDGVLIRGNSAIPGAKNVIERLQYNKIPYIYMTNGGGETEEARAQRLTNKLGVKVDHEQICLCHSPMKKLAMKYCEELVLAVGKKHDMLHDIMKAYGFRKVVTIDDLHMHLPLVYPDINVQQKSNFHASNERVSAIFVLSDPLHWGRELQIMLDIILSGGVLEAPMSTEQKIPVYNACSDLHYAADFTHPRLGAGAFRVVFEDFYKRIAGKELEQELYGKPHTLSYEYAETLLDEQAKKLGFSKLEKIYAIGDNPETDVKGANEAGGKWISMLTRSGVFQGANHPIYRAKIVVDDVNEAMNYLQKQHVLK